MFESKRKTQLCEVSTLRGVMGCCKSSRGFSVQGSTQRADTMSLTTTPAVSSPCVCVGAGGGVARQQAPPPPQTAGPIACTYSICVPIAHTHSTGAFPLHVRTLCTCPHRKYVLRVAGSLRGSRSWASSRHSCCCSVSTVLRCSSCSWRTCSRKPARRASC